MQQDQKVTKEKKREIDGDVVKGRERDEIKENVNGNQQIQSK